MLLKMKPTIRVLCSCWKSSQKFLELARVYNYGIEPYCFDSFQKVNTMVEEMEMNKEDGHIIREAIMEIIRNLKENYSELVLDQFIELWYSKCKYRVYPPEPHSSESLMKIIEVLIMVGIQIDELVTYMPKSRRFLKVSYYYQKISKRGSNYSQLNQSVANIE